MTLKVKSIIISCLIITVVTLSFKLFIDFRSLHLSMITNLFSSGQIIISEAEIYRHLTKERPDIEKAREIVRAVPGIIKKMDLKNLTDKENHDVISIKTAFIRVERILNGIPLGEATTNHELRQISNELEKITLSTTEFRASFKERMDRETARRARLQAIIFATAGFGIVLIFIGFHYYFLKPVKELTSQVGAVRKGETENISIYKSGDEFERLSEFIFSTLNDLKKSNDALLERFEIQYATSEILRASQKASDIESFLNIAIEKILSVKWLSILNKGAIFLVDESNPELLILTAGKNLTESQKKTCAVVSVGKCVCGMTAQSKKAVYKLSIDEDHEDMYDGMAPHGHYCVPIKKDEDVLGVISLYVEEGHQLNDFEKEFIDAISIIIAEALMIRRLSERQRLITTAIEEAGEGVMIANKNMTIEYINPAIVRITGYKEDELIGKSLFTQIQSLELTEALWGDIREVMHGNAWSSNLRNKKKDGTEYLEHMTIIPVKDENGALKKFVAVRHDITRERQLEEQLLHSQKMEAIGQLAGGVAHDFNNILTAIIGYGRLLQESLSKESPNMEYAAEIVSAAKRAANLTQSLLTFSRKQIIHLEPLDLKEIIKGLQNLLSRIIGEDIELRTIFTDRDLKIMADKGQIEQVLMNLATNAKDAMPDGGLLTIEAKAVEIDKEYMKTHAVEKTGMYALISVSDTGFGIDEETKQKIFEPFFTTKGPGKGTGLGLSIIHGIIKQHNGFINVYSELGKGTTFKIYLPLIETEVKSKAEIRPFVSAVSGTETILIAEDDKAVRNLTKKLLERHGYRVIEAEDGEAAVKEFLRNKDIIKLIILDIIMPKKNGREIYKEIKDIKPDIKAIFTSGYAADIVHAKGLLEKGLDLILKPAVPDELLTKVREVLDR